MRLTEFAWWSRIGGDLPAFVQLPGVVVKSLRYG